MIKPTLALIFLVLLLSAMPAHSQQGHVVVVINFHYTVDLGASSLFRSAVNYAIQNRAKTILIIMNSPGGYISDMLNIISYIREANQSGIPVYTYVIPDGLAASAASYIAMATNMIIMGPGSEIGPSTPIVVGGTQLEQNHTESAMLSLMQSEAQEWGRNVTAASVMVLYDKAYSAQQAYNVGLINGLASNLTQAENMLGISGFPQVYFSESYYDQFLSVISNPTVDGLLILLGMVLIALDVLHPTFLMSVLGGIALLMGLVGAELIGASVLGLILLAVSAVLLVMEIKTGHGISLIASVLVGLAGIYLLGEGIQVSPQPSYLEYYIIAVALVAFAVFAAIYIRSLWKYKRKYPFTGKESLIGKTGVVVKELNPCGEIKVEGFIWKACTKGEKVKKGEEVTVIGYKGLSMIVEKKTKG
ncbi:MAG: nodulation protein NfeD [Thaumarchaeota archaeon]|jgi:membrane-bound serine protease (ClpP class)|nr:nodulation protein NfeD [Nitrososphaerota archaeon]